MTADTTTPRPQTTARLDRLVDEVRKVVRRGLPHDRTARLVGERLGHHLGAADLLTGRQSEGDPDHYRQHVLHAEGDGSFSIVSLVWLPGQRTAVHDHVSWCVTGVHIGREDERRYEMRSEEEGTGRLVFTRDVVNDQGDVCGFAPPGDIHRVRNAGSGKAISLHVYGADITRLGTSIRRVYEPPADER